MIAQGDAVRIPLADRSVHCVVTSPPYWGLRKYAGGQGDEPLGLESTPERHVERMVEVFREVRRVLRDDGVVWLNYGDCYGHGTEARRPQGNTRGISDKTSDAQNINRHGGTAGNLMMMPHRVALALQADGWIIRQDLVWFKRNPMPESIAGTRWVKHRIKEKRSKHATDHNIKGGTEAMLRDASIHTGINEDWVPEYVDCPGCEKCIPNDGLVLKRGSWRHTRSHEFIFMLTKKMGYFANQEAVREGLQQSSIDRINQETFHEQQGGEKDYKHGTNSNRSMRKTLENFAESRAGRNPRSVLDVPTQPYKGSHYATFPVNLIAPLIRATCPRRCCPVCGQGWAAVVEIGYNTAGTAGGKYKKQGKHSAYVATHGQVLNSDNRVLGYRPTCMCCKICVAEGLTPKEMEKRHATQRSRSSSPVPEKIQTKEIPHRSDLSGKRQGKKSKVSGELSEVQQVIHGEATDSEVLQPEMFSKVDVGNKTRTPIPKTSDGEVSLQAREWEEDSSASGGHGAALGSSTKRRRNDPPHQSGSGRQSDRELADSDERRTRQHSLEVVSEPHEIVSFPKEEAVPGIVFDPFVGSGTTIAVAKSLLRRGIGIDISMEYLDQQAKVRAGLGTPSKALEDLPLFSGKEPAPPLNKQDSLGKSTYTGFNARWKEKHQ